MASSGCVPSARRTSSAIDSTYSTRPCRPPATWARFFTWGPATKSKTSPVAALSFTCRVAWSMASTVAVALVVLVSE